VSGGGLAAQTNTTQQQPKGLITQAFGQNCYRAHISIQH